MNLESTSHRLSKFSKAVRESTMKRLKTVPPGKENWRISPEAMSFADTARHLIACDLKMFRKLETKDHSTMHDNIVIEDVKDRSQYDQMLAELENLCARRAEMLSSMTDKAFSEKLFDDRFGGKVTAWWVIMRGNLDHEIHHRGQIAPRDRLSAGKLPTYCFPHRCHSGLDPESIHTSLSFPTPIGNPEHGPLGKCRRGLR